MDEPTTGLDVEARHGLWEVMRAFVAEGGALLLTTHYLEEAQALASRVMVLAQGRVIAHGSVDDLIARVGLSGERASLEEAFLHLTGGQP
jgi:ABC-2 type transport system ATP-binding protein